MIRHFLGVIFWSFIGFVVFVNLFQFSGAVVPFEDTGFFRQDLSNTYFGFSSIFNFVKALGSNSILDSGIKIFSSGFSVVKMFSIDDIVSLFTDLQSMSDESASTNIVVVVVSVFKIIGHGLVAPFTILYGLIVMIVGLVLFLWSFISVFMQFLLGYYNAPLPSDSFIILASAVSTSLV